MVQRIYVIGYYNHSNAGDEQYKRSFQILFEQHLNTDFDMNFVDCDNVSNMEFADDDIIVLGGGDVLNDYFLDPLIEKFTRKCNKIIAVSVGTPFLSLVKTTNKLDIIDYFFIRSSQDYDLFCEHFTQERVFYLPDLSIVLPSLKIQKTNTTSAQQRIAFALTSDILNKRFPVEAKNVIGGLITFTERLVDMGYHIVFVPFNCNPNNSNENDNYIHNDIVNAFSQETRERCLEVITTQLHETEIIDIFDSCDYVIPMRFHACLFALYRQKPFMPLFTSRKVQNLLLDVNWNHGYKMTTNEFGVPIEFDPELAISRFIGLTKSAVHFEKKFGAIAKQLNEAFSSAVPQLMDIICKRESRGEKHVKGKWDSVITSVTSALDKIAGDNGYPDFRCVTDKELQDTLVKVASYYLTGGVIASKYNYGLSQKMFMENFDYEREFRWIMDDCALHPGATRLVNNPEGLYNLSYIDQVDYSGAHRSGWQYVYDNIKRFHNRDKILLDLYVDRTFHWHSKMNQLLGVIPYKKPWVGFVHHTFDTEFSEYNCSKLLESSVFIESLRVCRGLVVLSKYLKKQLQLALREKGVKDVPVFVMTHPTSTDVVEWDWNKFVSNQDKRLVHVGGWLRDIYSFYGIVMPEDTSRKGCFRKPTRPALRKVALRGRGMSNYFPSDLFLDNLYRCLVGQPGGNSNRNISIGPNPNVSTGGLNTWYNYFYNDVRDKVDSVEIIDYLQNSRYDVLLSDNIVFINLVDASAVNTVIECMVRCTPIIVNKHPAVVELLGEKYPLYFVNNADLSKQICNLTSYKSIKRAYKYLKALRTPQLQIESFVDQLNDIMSRVQ